MVNGLKILSKILWVYNFLHLFSFERFIIIEIETMYQWIN